ncbi:ATP-binding protein [Hymenobacter sp. BT175]|uniref:ATP-binding protein n=1 Tax=Hymenobacter translucens TaxID=2886507 RepID=UPI001D0EAF32|nr:ATP-binding protein [Hymenobacter translucens]MCC2545343.1 ATP-binding protein [Hymenobacter translucens]
MALTDFLANGNVLRAELYWLSEVVTTRINLYFGLESAYAAVADVPLPELPPADAAPYARLVRQHALSREERLVLALTLAPHLQPQLLDAFFVRNTLYDRGFTEFGGVKGKNHGGFLPTAETALFLLAADDLGGRLYWQTFLWQDSALTRADLVRLTPPESNEPLTSAALTVPPEELALLLTGQRPQPAHNSDFPARLVTTALDWGDLVLDYHVREEVRELQVWLEHEEMLLRDAHLRRHLKPGYRALFYGPPGTGKTLTACLLGKTTGRDVYRVDLSMVVSKYIGETEKNLGRLFDLAEHRHWILFFDEADALFGKRTAASSSNDRHANQEVAYLLQRIEDFPGVVILASNLKGNLDEAFARRFQSMIYFPMPGPPERLQLWQHAFAGVQPQETLGFEELAEKYALAGGAITNVLRYSVLASLRHERGVQLDDVVKGVQREFAKEGKTA